MTKVICPGESEKMKGWERKGLSCFSSPSCKGKKCKAIAERQLQKCFSHREVVHLDVLLESVCF